MNDLDKTWADFGYEMQTMARESAAWKAGVRRAAGIFFPLGMLAGATLSWICWQVLLPMFK